MDKYEWPTGCDYFNQTNVKSIVRGIVKCDVGLGFNFLSIHSDEDLLTVVNYPTLTMVNDIGAFHGKEEG